MKLFRRFTTTVSAGVEQAIAQIENHDAVVSAALQDARKSAADAKVRLRRVQRDGAGLQERCHALSEDVQRWAERAKRSSPDNEALALECVARMRAAERELQHCQQASAEHRQQQVALEAAAEKIQQRIKDIEQQQRLLRTRQSSARAQHLAARLQPYGNSDMGEGVDEVLARWESTILAKEDLDVVAPIDAPADPLAEEFQREEDDAALRAALKDLLAADNVDNKGEQS